MKTSKEIHELANAIDEATRVYYRAIADNLKECGKELNVMNIWEDEDEDGELLIGLRLSVRGDDNDLNDEVIDKVRWNNEKNYVEYHSISYNYRQIDEWANVAWLGDDVDYVYEAIEWEE